MAALKSTQFYAGTPAAGTTPVAYTVPAGHVIILKNVTMMNQTGSAKIGFVNRAGGVRIRTVTLAAIGVPTSTDTWNTWLVLTAGDQLLVGQQAGGAVAYVLSGSLLYI